MLRLQSWPSNSVVQVMRRHLRSLERDELVEASPQSGGPGRPSNAGASPLQGRGRFPDGSEHFALGLLQSLSTALPPEQVKGLLSTQADLQAGATATNSAISPCLAGWKSWWNLRRREGYVADCRQDPDSSAWLLQEYHCSVSRVAEAFPLICDQELQVMRRTFPDCSVERVHWKLDGDHTCGFRLTPRA